jgi:branched-chain amino acid transport system substrate-binding protein
MKISTLCFITICLAVWGFQPSDCLGDPKRPILIGLDADMSSGSARSGRAIRRGAELAMDEINGSGGVLGRPLQLIVRDHRGNPARGVDNIHELSQIPDIVAVIGGLHTPVALAELPIIHEKKLIYLSPWAAGTPIVKNKYSPNFVFRVSVRDEFAGSFLVNQAVEKGYKHPALVLEQTGWGRSNQASMTRAMQEKGIASAGSFWFNWGVRDLTGQIRAARAAGADVVLLVANAPEGVVMVKSMAVLREKERLPIISHWGITGGNFFELAKSWLGAVNLQFLQTYSFVDPVFFDRNQRLVTAYLKKYPDTGSADDIFSPVGTAHAYDLVHLLKLAVEQAGDIDRSRVRDCLETLPAYRGIVKDYLPPFTPRRHDALDAGDFTLAVYDEAGRIIPLGSHPKK